MAVLAQGQRLGSYEIESLLGRGGMAEVYRATHRTLERNVAIKVLNPVLNADPTFPLRFLREAKAVARLNHPNIITIYDFGEQEELAYLVMELAPGGTFRERARRLRTLGEAVETMAPVFEAIQYAHDRGIIHRDIKPINVFISEQDRPLLADFGLARVASESIDLTGSGVGFGSPHYMAPEQAMAVEIDHRADIYALGVVAYEVIAGRLPYVGTTPYAVIQQHLNAPPPSICSVLPDAPEALDAAIHRAMAKEPADRFSSAMDLLATLRRAAAEAPDLPIRTAAAQASAEQSTTSPLASGPSTDNPSLDLLQPTSPLSQPGSSQVTPRTVRGTVPTGADGDDDRTGEMAALPWPPPAAEPPREGRGPATLEEPKQAAPSPEPGSASENWLRRKARRPTSFSQTQWLAFGTAFLLVVFINAVGLWLTLAGRSAASGNVAQGVTTYIFDHLGAFKSSLAALALILAFLAVVSMRLAVVDRHRISPETYRKLRQYHRFVGYTAILIAFAVGLLTCIGIFGFGTKTPRAALHSTIGTATLVLILVKVAVVRYFPAQRRHLKLLGESLLLLFFLAFATSTIPFLWSHLAGTSKSNPYNPYVGRTHDPGSPYP